MKSGFCKQCLPLVAALAVLCGAISSAQAGVNTLNFTVDESLSSLTLTEIFLETLGVGLSPQDPGVSDIAQQTGQIIVEVDDVNNPTTIEFMGGEIAFVDNGNWLPDFLGGAAGDPGTAQPGSYGSQFIDVDLDVTFYSVFRESTYAFIMYDESDFGPPIVPDPIPVTAGSFPWDDVNSRVLADVRNGSWDWNLSGAFGEDFNGGWDPDDGDFGEPVDGADNVNIATTNGTYSVSGGLATLTIPFKARLGEDPDGDPSSLLAVFEGTIVATASIVTDPHNNADFDHNGIVNGDDFLIWQSGFGNPGEHVDGDADGNGVVNGDDFLVWQAQFGGPPPPPGGASSAVPEPASAGLAILAAMALAVAAVRKRLG